MAKIIYGERIGKQGKLRCGCAAAIFDDTKEKILLTRRTDNGQWCLPGGGIDPGESVTEACAREIQEETGLIVRVGRLIGIYSNPHQIVEYADGNRYHTIVLNFEADPMEGTLRLSNETTDVGYFTPAEIETLDVMEHHRERIQDAYTHQAVPFIK